MTAFISLVGLINTLEWDIHYLFHKHYNKSEMFLRHGFHQFTGHIESHFSVDRRTFHLGKEVEESLACSLVVLRVFIKEVDGVQQVLFWRAEETAHQEDLLKNILF